MPALLNDELHTAEWLRTKLASIASGGAWLDLVPEDSTFPAVRYHVQARHDVRGMGRSTQRILTQIDWLVVAIVQGPGLVALVPLADAIDQALHEASGSTSTLDVLTCVRLQPFTLTEVGRSGVQFRHAGGLYRTLVKAK